MTARWKHLRGEKPKRKVKRTEDQLQCAVVYLLKRDFPNLFFFHTPNGMKSTAKQGAKMKAMGVKRGTPDLLFIWATDRLQMGAIELKSPAGRLQPEQKVWRDQFMAMGGKWALARSYEEVRFTLQEWGVRP